MAALAARSADQRETEFWMPREADWVGALKACDDKRASGVAVSDAHNATAAALVKKLEARRLRGWLPW